MLGLKLNRLVVNKAPSPSSLATFSTTYQRLKAVNNNNYEYLQESIIPTMHFQKSLQKLAIPKLEDSCQRYLSALKPILSETEYQTAEKETKQFQQSDGKGNIF
jgi:carnitine O-palmitoyltransferase 2